MECEESLHAPWRARRPRTGRGDCPFCRGREHLTPPTVASAVAEGGSVRLYRGLHPRWTARIVPNAYPAVRGQPHEVVIESPVHVRDPHEDPDSFAAAVLLALERLREIAGQGLYPAWFKNRGPGAGASVEHAHSQIVALPAPPPRVRALEPLYKPPGCIACTQARPVKTYRGRVYLAAHPAPRLSHELLIAPAAHEPYPWQPGPLEEAAAALAEALADASRFYTQCLGVDSYNYWLHLPTTPRAGAHWRVEAAPAAPLGGLERGYGAYVRTTSPRDVELKLRECIA